MKESLKCWYCRRKFEAWDELKSHLIDKHRERYIPDMKKRMEEAGIPYSPSLLPAESFGNA